MPQTLKPKPFPHLLHETASSWRNLLDKRLKPLGLSQAKWRTLLHLSLADHPLTQTELAVKLGVEGATLVGIIDRLAGEGWLIRQPGLTDRRIKTLHLTAKAENTLTQILSIANQLSDELLSPIPEDKLKTCMEVLDMIKTQASQYNA